jgi:hypothetical protein
MFSLYVLSFSAFVFRLTPLHYPSHFAVNRDNAVGIATGYGLDDRGVGVRVPVGSRISLLHVVQTGSEVHPTSYPMGTGGSFPRGKAAGAWNWPLAAN